MRLTTDIVRNDFSTRMAPHLDGARQRAFDNWLAEELRQAQETAWDEGAILASNIYPLDPDSHNPYRSQP